MKQTKSPKILYFIDGPVPNSRNRQEASALIAKGATVVFRNARFVSKDDVSPEENTAAVMGDDKIIPTIYKTFPSPEEAVAKYVAAMEADSKAPSGLNNDGEQDNFGTHTLPNPNQVPYALKARDAAPAPVAQPAAPVAQPGPVSGAAPLPPAFGATPAFDPNNLPK